MSHESDTIGKQRIKSFRDLEVWKTAMQIVKLVYGYVARLPKQEEYVLSSQMRRAAVAMPSNVAEGFRRRNEKEFRQFLHIAIGSAAELETQVELCRDLFGLEEKATKELLELLDRFQAMTMSLIKRLGS